jgi:DedD protein
MPEVQDTEVTLGTGRLLGLFFGLVVICALFFSLGFSLGRKASPAPAAADAAPSPAPVATTSQGPKPSGVKGDAKADCPTPDGCPQTAQQPGSTSDELTFYKAVEQNDPNAQLQQPAAKDAAAAPATAPAPAAPANKPPEIAKPAPGGVGYMVQVAAVSKQEDADALVAALRKKDYPVFSVSLPTDKLFHVQVGPFADLKDAEAMKTKLVGDGYNPIVKR